MRVPKALTGPTKLLSIPTVAELSNPKLGGAGAAITFRDPPTLEGGKAGGGGSKNLSQGAAAEEEDHDSTDDELSKEMSERRRAKALEMSQKYDFNISAAANTLAFASGTRRRKQRGPMCYGRNTQPRQEPDEGAKRRAAHYSRWFLPAVGLCTFESS
jgi:hypothetical protein